MEKRRLLILREKQIIYFRTIFFSLIFLAFITLENATGIRLIKLIVLMILLIFLPFIRTQKKSLPFKKVFLLVVDAVLILLIGLSSRYVVNYYIYALYMILMVEAGFIYELKYSKYVIAIISIFTLYHYAVLYYYRSNLGTVSEIFFLVLINTVIILGVVFVKYQKEEKEKQKILFDTLEKTHSELLNTTEKLEKLTRVEVKNNIARDIHDTFGHDMMALIMEIEMADILIGEDKDKAKEMLKQAKNSARNGMKTIRKVVETLRDESESIISETIEEMIDQFSKRVDLKVDVFLDEKFYDCSKNIHDSLYRLVQECLTNSVRHGEADYVKIKLERIDNKIMFLISDNGKGNKSFDEGYGLKGMRERISALNGELNIDGLNGFKVEGYIEV